MMFWLLASTGRFCFDLVAWVTQTLQGADVSGFGVTSVENGADGTRIVIFFTEDSASKSNPPTSTLRTLGLSLVWK